VRAAVFTHGEQKNGAIVRHLVGYDRFASEAAYVQLARVYELGRLHVNFFQPVEKLVSKTRVGAHTRRYYDRPDSVSLKAPRDGFGNPEL
jgi:hypothetical protein